MEKQQIIDLMNWLKSRVSLIDKDGKNIIKFAEPDADDFTAAGFEDHVIKLSLKAPWWDEMVTDIIETPEYVEPGSAPDITLNYARDVVKEYIGKRLLP